MLKKTNKFEWFLILGFAGGALLSIYFPFLLKYSWFSLLTLCAYFIYHLLNQSTLQSLFLFLLISFFGYLSEVLGVNTGLFFGKYSYLNNLGVKAFGVPLIIGINWGLLIFAGYIICTSITQKILSVLINGFLCVLTDLLMEPTAPKLGFWKFEGGKPGSYNYLCWFLLSVLYSYILFVFFKNKKNKILNKAAIWVYICIVIFYIIVLLIL